MAEFNFVHLSDIHFGGLRAQGQFERDAPLRQALLDSLSNLPGDCNAFDGVLVSGDVAFSGASDEYNRADKWLGNVCEKGHCDRNAIYAVPGNHDVTRSSTERETIIWAAHERIRTCNPNQRHEALRRQLQSPTNPLATFQAFNDFAARYSCTTSPNELAWVQELPKQFRDGTGLRLHGLNSAIISDEDDAPSKLFVSEFQLSNLTLDASVVRLVMCHHPPAWLCDRQKVNDVFNANAQIVFFGHEHTARINRIDNTLYVCAGAVHPSRNEPGWKPCYNFVQLAIENAPSRVLRVKIFPRVWDEQSQRFIPEYRDGNPFREDCIPLPPLPAASRNILHREDASAVSSSLLMGMHTPNPDLTTAKRTLRIHFYGLSKVARYNVALDLGLLGRANDDKLTGNELWDQILNRAESQNLLHQLWAKSAEHNQEMANERNPF